MFMTFLVALSHHPALEQHTLGCEHLAQTLFASNGCSTQLSDREFPFASDRAVPCQNHLFERVRYFIDAALDGHASHGIVPLSSTPGQGRTRATLSQRSGAIDPGSN